MRLQAAPHSAEVESVQTGDPPRPSAAETARTVLDIVAHGTLATIDDDGNPLGTYASYVLDTKASSWVLCPGAPSCRAALYHKRCALSCAVLTAGIADVNRVQLQGQPVLRLRADAVHTANLLRKPACSLFVQVLPPHQSFACCGVGVAGRCVSAATPPFLLRSNSVWFCSPVMPDVLPQWMRRRHTRILLLSCITVLTVGHNSNLTATRRRTCRRGCWRGSR